MALVSLRQLLDHAAENGYGLPAFNVNNLEQIHAIMQAADECDSPVIMQGSAGARKYAGEAFLRHLIEAAVESYPHIHRHARDHGASPRYVSTPSQRLSCDGWISQADARRHHHQFIMLRLQEGRGDGHAVEFPSRVVGCLGSLESGMGEAENGHGAKVSSPMINY
jgi:fructose-bisphosphate aldolase class II